LKRACNERGGRVSSFRRSRLCYTHPFSLSDEKASICWPFSSSANHLLTTC
jgi:hypothetical protein